MDGRLTQIVDDTTAVKMFAGGTLERGTNVEAVARGVLRR